MGGVVEKVVGVGNGETAVIAAKPAGEFVLDHLLVGTHHFHVVNLMGLDLVSGCQRIVNFDKQTPSVVDRQLQKIELGQVDRVEHEAEVEQPRFQPVGDVLDIAAVKMEVDLGVVLLGGGDRFCQNGRCRCFGCPDMDVPRQDIGTAFHHLLGLVDQEENLLCLFFQKEPVVGQDDVAVGPDEKLLVEFFLELLHLARQGRLGDVEFFGGLDNCLFLGDSQKIMQSSKFHWLSPFPHIDMDC